MHDGIILDPHTTSSQMQNVTRAVMETTTWKCSHLSSTTNDVLLFFPQEGKFAVNSAYEAVAGALAMRAVHDRVVLNHYVTKSRAEYAAKMVRGSAMGNQASARASWA